MKELILFCKHVSSQYCHLQASNIKIIKVLYDRSECHGYFLGVKAAGVYD